MKKTITLYWFLLSYVLLTAQIHDNTWLVGYSNNQDTTDKFGIVEMTFPDARFRLRQRTDMDINFDATNSNFSDSTGQLRLITNGVHIFDGEGNIMEGGAQITDFDEAGGAVFDQYSLIIPWPGQTSKYLIFYEEYAFLQSTTDLGATGLYYAVADLSLNGGAGKVTTRRNIVIQDTLWLGHIVPVRHANGRDWWLLMNEFHTNRYYRILIDPTGVHVDGVQEIGFQVYPGGGQSVYSPDGRFYISFNAVSNAVGSYLDIYDFDRCTGLLSQHRQQHDIVRRGGVAVSLHNRYLYQNFDTKAFQYDLTAPDILATKTQIAEWDGTYSPFATTFGSLRLALDGKIYATAVCGCDVMHVIQRPDEAAGDCTFQQRAIQLPTYNAFSMPNFPYYRLGPLDGSACDTLGLNNDPVSWWRYEQDTLDPLRVAFRDLSYHEPQAWLWDFGDGSTSTERHPAHDYDSAGIYSVCLTVTNGYGAHTHCQTLYLGVSATDNPVLQAQVQVSPNPFTNHLAVSLSTPLLSPVFRLYDSMGRLVREQPLAYGLTELSTGDVPPGLYFWQVLSDGEVVKAGKGVKVE